MNRFSTILLFAVLAATALQADDGQIPLWQPTVITQPGSYIVTRDISTAVGSVLDIQTENVVVDLNGFTLQTTDFTADVIRFDPGAARADHGDHRFDLHHGMLLDGRNGLRVFSAEHRNVRLRDVQIGRSAEAAVKVDHVGTFEARGIIIVEGKLGMDLQCPAGSSCGPATIAHSSIQAEGGIHCSGVACDVNDTYFDIGSASGTSTLPALRLANAPGGGARGIVIVNNMPVGASPLVELIGSRGIVIVNSRVFGGAAAAGGSCLSVDGMSHDALIQHNSFTGCAQDGILLMSDGNSALDNLVSGNGGDGISVSGDNNLIQGNKAGNNGGVGINFATSDHVYRANVLHGNTGGDTGGAGANDVIDGGGNIQ